jgi:tetratricopeptide (TPR) repeat protein
MELEARARHYFFLCRELLSRGETAQARLILEELPRVTSADPEALAELRARLALMEGDHAAASQLLAQCRAEAVAEIRADLAIASRLRATAQELHNYALANARAGNTRLAAEQLQRAVGYDPASPALWQLKLQVDLMCAYFNRCYEDLRHLDHLGARPTEYAALEEALPPVA